MKRFVIAVDLEGVACVVGAPGAGLTREACADEYDMAVREAVRAANAAARALFDAGADDVIVWDNHGVGHNLPAEALDARVQILRGPCPERWALLEDPCAGVLLIGYHSMAGTKNGVLAHSYSSATIQAIRVNGVEVGEMAIDGHFAGLKGIPVIFVSSDKAGADEGARFFPWARTLAVKTGCARNAAICLHPLEVERRTYEQVFDAATHLSEMKPFLFDRPMTVEYRYMRMEDARKTAERGGDMPDGYTARFHLDEMRLY